jgi:hypothetical protein
LEDALKVVQGWDPRVAAIISHTPEGQLIDHKLLWRDPLPRWVSNYGRILSAIKEYYDPTCHIILDGQVLAHDRDSMMVNYTDIWAKMIKEKKTPVEAIEIHPIENGLSIVLREGSNPKLATVVLGGISL